MEISHVFDSGSKELAEYLDKFRVGSKLDSPDGIVSWTIEEVDVDDTIPPNPLTGKASTRVGLTINKPQPKDNTST